MKASRTRRLCNKRTEFLDFSLDYNKQSTTPLQFSITIMPTTVEIELKKVEVQLISEIDRLCNIRSEILNIKEDKFFAYRINKSTGNVPEVTVAEILNTTRRLHFFSRKMVKLIHAVGFERFMVRLLKQAHLPSPPTSDDMDNYPEYFEAMDNYPEYFEANVDVDANIALIGSGNGCLTLPANFNLKKSHNIWECDQIIAGYCAFTKDTYGGGGGNGTVKNGVVVPDIRLQTMRIPHTVESVSQLHPTNNVEFCTQLISHWTDFVHNELFRSMRTIPTEFIVNPQLGVV